tara:strand:+ start:6256 stop:6951 length:696 start_codon:yes stop_codon:yes gene_type:complete
MVKRAERLAELQAMIESAKAEIKQIQADEQAEKAETETGKAMNFKAAASDDRGLTGNRDADGNFVPENVDGAPMNFKEAAGSKGGLEVPITVSKEEMDERVIDKDMRTDEESARRKFTGVEPVETVPSSQGGDLEMGGGRAKGEEVEPSERTMGFQTDEGGIMSVDEKDDYWKTQEGYDKALEMYGRKPAWIKEPTLQWNPEEQKYEKIEEEEFEDLSSPAISDDVKALFG